MTTTGAALAHWTDRLPPPPAVGPVEAEPSTPSVKVPRQTDAPGDGCPGRGAVQPALTCSQDRLPGEPGGSWWCL